MTYGVCDGCVGDLLYHTRDKPARQRLDSSFQEEHDHYTFLYAVSSKCPTFVQFWLGSGADLNRRTERHADWSLLAWATWSEVGLEIIDLVTSSRWSNREAIDGIEKDLDRTACKCKQDAGAGQDVPDDSHLTVRKRSRSPLRGVWAVSQPRGPTESTFKQKSPMPTYANQNRLPASPPHEVP